MVDTRVDFDSEKLEEIINGVRSGIYDSVHVHNFVRTTVVKDRERILDRIKTFYRSTLRFCEIHTRIENAVLYKYVDVTKENGNNTT